MVQTSTTTAAPPSSTTTTIEQLRALPTDVDRYVALRNLQANNAATFFALCFQHTEEALPWLYTPTVGEACQTYCQRGFATRGLVLTARDAGRMLQKLQAWPQQGISLIVVTDGERVLGLGDLGVGGMAISEGKALLYTLAGGLHPSACLPVCLDVGTNNAALRADPSYWGLKQPRLTGAAYDAVVDEFMAAVQAWRPHVLVQFEDFGNTNAFRVLDRWRSRACCFNDDINGTAAVALAAMLAGLRLIGGSLDQQTLLFLGAGEAGTAIGELVSQCLVARHGLSLADARRRCWFVDSQGLVCAQRRRDLAHHKLPFAHESPFLRDLESAVAALKPTMLIGASAQPGAFTPRILQQMAQHSARPFILPLSNPTSKAECSAADAFGATGGRCVFASGSPFPPLVLQDGSQVFPAQANNALIFPAVGHAAVLTQCSTIPPEVFLRAAESLAGMASAQQLQQGRLFPALSDVRTVQAQLCAELGAFLVSQGLGQPPAAGLTGSSSQQEWLGVVRSRMFEPAGGGVVGGGGGAAGGAEDHGSSVTRSRL